VADSSQTVRSVIDGIAWPGIPGPVSAQLLAMQFQFDRTQYWPAAELQAHQFRQLDQLVAFCFAAIPATAERLAAAGIRPGEPLTIEAWRRLPVMTRRDVQADGARLRASQLPPSHGKAFLAQTSGSTGVSVTVLKSELSHVFWHAQSMRDMLWHEIDQRATFASIRRDPKAQASPPDGWTGAEWGNAFGAAFVTGRAGVLDIRSPVAVQVAWLARLQPAYLMSFPSNIALIAERCIATGEQLPGLRAVRSFGETLGDDVRELCALAWGVPVIDAYSAEEIGFIALQCPRHAHYHTLAETLLVEILDANDHPCGPGEIGRVVLTPLHNYAMPLLRYDIGDYAEAGPPCDCGRSLPVLSRLLGRARNRVVLPTGERRYSYFGARRFGDIDALIQYQVVQTTLERIEIRAVLRRPVTAEEADMLRNLVRSGLGYPFEVEIVPVDAIPRNESGKYEDFRSEVP
jgi:phenylacetate-CoA ligase